MIYHEDDLNRSITKLEKAVRRQNNLGWTFLRGVFYGIGWFIGGALLAAVLIYILAQMPESSALGKFTHNILDLVDKTKR